MVCFRPIADISRWITLAEVDWLRQYFFGEPFRLRSRLSEEDCERRFEQTSRSVPPLIADTTPAATWKPFFGKKRVYAWYPSRRRSPWLRGSFYADGAHTIIEGRAGADFVTLTGALFLEAGLLYGAWGRPLLPLVLLTPIPIVFFVTRRSSSDGEPLIDFIQELLDAQNVLARPGDPIRR
jgi:hypothetical protein